MQQSVNCVKKSFQNSANKGLGYIGIVAQILSGEISVLA